MLMKSGFFEFIECLVFVCALGIQDSQCWGPLLSGLASQGVHTLCQEQTNADGTQSIRCLLLPW